MDTNFKTMQEIGLESGVDLCGSCCHSFPGCDGKNIILGTNTGCDNVAACSEYEAIEFRHPKHTGEI